MQASQGHFLKDDGYWDLGDKRPSRIGRPLWHSFAPRPKTQTHNQAAATQDEHSAIALSQRLTPLLDREIGTSLSAQELRQKRDALSRAQTGSEKMQTGISLSAREVERNARLVEEKASQLLIDARREIQGLRWHRSLGFVRHRSEGGLENSENWPRPDTKALRKY